MGKQKLRVRRPIHDANDNLVLAVGEIIDVDHPYADRNRCTVITDEEAAHFEKKAARSAEPAPKPKAAPKTAAAPTLDMSSGVSSEGSGD